MLFKICSLTCSILNISGKLCLSEKFIIDEVTYMIRFGIVGAGEIAQKFARDIKYSKGAVLTAVASRNLAKAEEFAQEFNIEFAFGSYEEMAKSNKIDAVYIATPHNFHKEQSILFMNNKKHVLCEKPIAVNTKEFEEMVFSAQKNKVLLMEAMWTRFLPSTLKVRETVQSKKLGKLKNVYLEFGFDVIGNVTESGRMLNPHLAGGSLLDMGVYPVAYTLNITDQKVKTIRAKSRFSHTGVDIDCVIDFVFEDQSTAKLISSIDQDKQSPGILEFEKGTIIIDEFWRSQKVTINDKEFLFPHIGEGFPYEINSFVETLESGHLENNIMTHDQSRKSMQMLDEIRKVVGLTYPFESK